ncbi:MULTISPECIES: AAA family ATPase [Pectobacterium]|uniref:AAA family ATPase n=1 Tax=Pectobacterium TaxID=122277 RepID=UPI00094A6A68|nr:AAA family ATPase [Pectobacterium brasiliense]APS29568.1 hypothetical protein NC16_07505 [Pectobacterium brasiliense]MBN3101367.1 ATP-binding protein [Pectobacterium brasiliense]WGL26574.1 AAA family ATPase [Pectobacterium brasiliense]
MLSEKSEFDGVIGVGRVQLELKPDQRIYTFIGENGIGKTKTLEALFQVLFFTNSLVDKSLLGLERIYLKFKKYEESSFSIIRGEDSPPNYMNIRKIFIKRKHQIPVLFLGSQTRGFIKSESRRTYELLGDLEKRRSEYISSVVKKMENSFSNMNMDSDIEQWFVTLAQSSNPYQKKEDNRGLEIETITKILNEIDNRIDPDFLEINGDGRVTIKIEGQKRELSHLSSGFSSIIKLIQAIVSGYGFFTNESNIQHVNGIVLIDEIESHLHLKWQANIIPLLKKIFPNTVFYITTHSSVVLSQLKDGEAYKMYRDSSGIVKTKKIQSPNNSAFIDILNDVFQIDLNKKKLDNVDANEQQDAKKNLLELLKKQGKK